MKSPDSADLEACLDATRTALLAGDMAHLARLSELVDAALGDVGTLPAAVSQRLRMKADQNGLLLEAALKGVRSASQRAKELSSQGRFSTYGAGGQRDQLGISPSGLARRV